MCGILFSLSTVDKPIDKAEWDTLKELNNRRGPDAQQLVAIQIQNKHDLQFYSTVLHLRGLETVSQPLRNTTGDILCWNGEIFSGLEIKPHENDTLVLMDRLNKATTEEDTLAVFSMIEGPYAFVYWKAQLKKIYFGRDCLGRRSLLWNYGADKPFMLSSVSKSSEGMEWAEVPANGIYCIDISHSSADSILPVIADCSVQFIPWVQQEEKTSHSLILPFPRLNSTLPTDLQPVIDVNVVPEIDDCMHTTLQQFISVLDESVKNRLADIPYLSSKNEARVAILFSGGLDCITLAALAHKHLPISEPIDLLNVAFENPRVVEAKTQSKLKKTNKKKKKSSEETAVEEKPVIKSIPVSMYDTPDRLTGRAGVEELRQIAPDRTWNFVEIDVPYTEAVEYRQQIIDRMYPLDTVMDLSIAMAFWFASRGKGHIMVNEQMQTYDSHARVLISGLGADEQLGGYSRHKEAFRKGGWEQLINETQLDVDRISTRNLGRDDRIMSDHGKEVRFPFLGTKVVAWLCQQPIELKMDLRYERGIGEKLLLRHAARQLGLHKASHNWKRAIQFGAKTAKMTGQNRAEKGQHKLV
ncbi:asparagine synthase-domain-containing protein [Pilobolus umbonatus]|nr:asparagine synthase-domain-containing protein [Pilobolus umbonatus]